MSEYIVYYPQYEHLSIHEFILSFKEKIVRCKNCMYFGCYAGTTWCSRTYEQVSSGTCDYQTVEPDGFCKWGKAVEE